MEYTVRGDGPGGGGEHPGAVARLLLLYFLDAYRILRQGKGAVGVLGFQWSFHDFAVDPGDLPFCPEVAPVQINVFPLQPQ